MNKLSKYKGSLCGLAIGDAVGTTLEFKSPGSFDPIDDLIGGGFFKLKPGQWTDDTSMALCLAESLIEKKGFDPKDQLERYVRWYREGYLSSTGTCFDIGRTISLALQRFEKTGGSFCGSTDPRAAGNGSIMRLAPVPLFYSNNPDEAVIMSGESSRTTHGAQTAIDACRYLGGLIVGAVHGISKHELLTDCYYPDFNSLKKWKINELCSEIYEISRGSFKKKQPPKIKGSGYVANSLEAALWAFYNSDSFREGCLKAVNLGDDSDTTGAVYGQLAGAYYGIQEIPKNWLNKLYKKQFIEELAVKLYS